MTRERRSSDPLVKRLRQLQDRLDVLLHESQQLRSIDTGDSTRWPTVRDDDESPETPGPPRK